MLCAVEMKTGRRLFACAGDFLGVGLPFRPWMRQLNLRATPFTQVLLGGVVTSSGIQTIGWQNHFAMTACGGIDLRLTERFSLRPLQAEYFLTKIPDGLDNHQNNFRFSTRTTCSNPAPTEALVDFSRRSPASPT
jgi:hypothetical protein